MDDSISRAAVLEIIREYCPDEPISKDLREYWVKRFEPLIRVREEVEKIPLSDGWIPCGEQLPEEYGEYRITWTTSASKKRFVGDAEYEVTDEWDDKRNGFKGVWLLDDYIKAYPDVNVIAWKLIEEPWKGEEK